MPLGPTARSVADMAMLRKAAPALYPDGSQDRANRTFSLGRLGNLEVRLATSATEIRHAQALRYQVFYEEMSASPDRRTAVRRLDEDKFDRVCDHLLVLDHGAAWRPRSDPRRAGVNSPEVIGTYRLLRQDIAKRHGGFYTAGEYDIGPLLKRKRHLRFLELGRSCVLKPYRSRRTIELLWHGIWTYVLTHQVDVMFGCASLGGTDPHRLALPLSYLHHHARAPEEWRVHAWPRDRVGRPAMPCSDLDARAVFRSLPPLIKGYLRLGAFAGDGAVVDRQFGTTDVCIILPVSEISRRYVDFYGAEAARHAGRRPGGC